MVIILFLLLVIFECSKIVTYPSLYEGFGNAFLEAVYFKKPILVNRYTVYIVDIEPKGFDVISIDGYLTKKTVSDVRDVLMNEERRKIMVEKNFALGKQYFSTTLLRKKSASFWTAYSEKREITKNFRIKPH